MHVSFADRLVLLWMIFNIDFLLVNTLKAWVAQNKQIAIPVFLFGSLIIVALLGWLAWFLVRRHRRNRLATAKDKDSRPPSTVHSVVVFDDNNDSRARRRHSHTGSSFHDNDQQPSSLFQSSTARTTNENNITTPAIFTTSSSSSPSPATRQEAWELQPISANNAVSPLADNRSTMYQSKNPYLASTAYATKASHLGDSPIAMNTTTAAEFSRLGGYTDTSSYLDNPDSVAVALATGGGGSGGGHRHRRVKSTTT